VSDDTVVSLAPDGEVVWRRRLTQLLPSATDLHDAATYGDLTLLHGRGPVRPDGEEFLVALDHDTGRPRWISHHPRAPLLADDAVIVRDDHGVARLDPASGDVLWERRVTGEPELHDDRLVLRGDRGLLLLDVDTGEPLLELERLLSGSTLLVDDLLVGIVREPPSERQELRSSEPARAVRHALVAIDVDGEVAWERELGSRRSWWWSCCALDADGETLVVASPGGDRRRFDLATGTPRDDGGADEAWLVPAPGLPRPPPPDRSEALGAWQPADVEDVAWHDDGRRLEVRSSAGTATIRAGTPIHVVSHDPLVVADGRHLLAVEPVAPTPGSPG
jgi:outer membrane protein assembly factor BamB